MPLVKVTVQEINPPPGAVHNNVNNQVIEPKAKEEVSEVKEDKNKKKKKRSNNKKKKSKGIEDFMENDEEAKAFQRQEEETQDEKT